MVMSIADWPTTFDNSLLKDLRKEETSQPFSESRQVKGAHYTLVRPTAPAPAPELVIAARDVAELIGISAEDIETEEFASIFAGSGVPESVPCWATAYGASFFGSYGGQRGDGRAISIGQVNAMEVQLKGAGVTPFSRHASHWQSAAARGRGGRSRTRSSSGWNSATSLARSRRAGTAGGTPPTPAAVPAIQKYPL